MEWLSFWLSRAVGENDTQSGVWLAQELPSKLRRRRQQVFLTNAHQHPSFQNLLSIFWIQILSLNLQKNKDSL